MRIGDEFIKKFNELEHLLRQKAGNRKYIPFFKLVDLVAGKDPTVRRREDILKSFGKLRNAIVHDSEYPERILADPRPEVVEELVRLCKDIAEPEKVIPRFEKSIRIFAVSDSLAECLTFMKENDFSQVVVVSNGRYVLLSSEGIVGWLSSARHGGLANFGKATVRDALRYEADNACRYLSCDEPVDVAIDAFEQAIAQGIPRLQAILVTQNGSAEERPLGIITPWDLLA